MTTTEIAGIVAKLTDGERRRLLDGRADWREDDWQDHCGDIACRQCDGEIPWPGPNDLSVDDLAVHAALQEAGE